MGGSIGSWEAGTMGGSMGGSEAGRVWMGG